MNTVLLPSPCMQILKKNPTKKYIFLLQYGTLLYFEKVLLSNEGHLISTINEALDGWDCSCYQQGWVLGLECCIHFLQQREETGFKYNFIK